MKPVILPDGGLGQKRVRRSQAEPTPLWSARVLIDEPDLVRDLHAEFFRAGARVTTLNTYSATPERLVREGAGERLGWVAAGLDIVGGCCEVGPPHNAALRDRMQSARYSISGVAHA